MLLRARTSRKLPSIFPCVPLVPASTSSPSPRHIQARTSRTHHRAVSSSAQLQVNINQSQSGLKAATPGNLLSSHILVYRSMSSLSATTESPNPELWGVESTTPNEPTIDAVFEKNTGTWQYLVSDAATSSAVIIDPVLDYDRATQTVSTQSADSLLKTVTEKGYKIEMILETHVHADHLTAASYLQRHLAQTQGFKPPVGIGKRIEQVQTLFGKRYEVPRAEYTGVFDKLFDDDETFKIGNLTAMAVHLPGHTPDHLGYRIGENIFCGDSLFHADIGTARCDFPGGSARDLFRSGRKLLDLPGQFKIWTGHDYPPQGREEPRPWMSVKEHRQQNKHLKDGTTEEQYIALREARDAEMQAPKLLHQSLQINIRAGQLLRPSQTGHRMLRLPMKFQGGEW
ncbi:Metallo-hydrolase/oxidoreductase [Aspergillus ellipticus CBS 707.79]|uniref:Metallo-hydrolase/oxidoreductase n=1 Tax=Aspergillus ellipticus CBS 707.79 TaxID=1448320 RepID=A0A319DAB3_9EURO|nr:Metallo-hydrolase/oxidoreductase [Aspergillus ellipticus CBS 707.79]